MPFKGTIDERGYTPPVAVQVHWSNGSIKFLDTSKDFAGWHDSDIPRYGGGDQSLAPHHPSAVGVEQRGGEAFAILAYLFKHADEAPDRLPTEQETSDFAVAHGGRRVLGRGDWLALAGVESPVQEGALGTARNPIIVNDQRFPKNHVRRIAGKVYMNDLDAKGAGPFPEEPVEPTPPPKPPPLPPPVQPNPPAVSGSTRQIAYTFDKELRLPLPVGATKVVFEGSLLLAGPVAKDTRSPLLKVALGPEPARGQRRFNAGSPVVNSRGALALEWADKTEAASGGRLPVGQALPIRFTWTSGVGSEVVLQGRKKASDPIPNTAAEGGSIVFGVEPGGVDYVLLPPGSTLLGVLTITGGAQRPGPTDPPPPSSSSLDRAKSLLRQALDELEPF